MLPRLESERQLLAIEASSVAWMSPESQRAVFARHSSRLDADQESRPRRATLADLARLGFTTRTVPKRRGTRSDKKEGA